MQPDTTLPHPVPEGAENPLAAAVAERDRDIIRMVQEAIARRDVLLAYQPVMQTARPDRPAFWEGLIRILDETGRVIPARDFIDVVETRELGRQIDCLSLEMGLQMLHEVPDLRLSVNMSARSIGYPRWNQVLEEGLARDVTVAERLILEITEASAMIMPDIVQVFMARMQRREVCFALDDFGAGYTAFRYLRQFFFDILKIDGQFIRDIHRDTDNQVLAQALIAIGRHFDMFTVAEYVENARDAEFLTDIGIDCMQGYYFGAPTTRPVWMPREEGRQAG
jgi:EAL domain-containing protein (putative c-di-GMP-specific phosphodiesterase class I)